QPRRPPDRRRLPSQRRDTGCHRADRGARLRDAGHRPAGGRQAAVPPAGAHRRRRHPDPGPAAAQRPPGGCQRGGGGARALRHASPGHQGPGGGGDHPRGAARRLAPAARLERRRTRWLRQLVAALTVLVLLTVGLAGYAFRQRQLLLTAQDPAQSRTVAIEADQVRANDPGLAAQLSVAAYDISHTQQARASLLESSAAPMAARMQDSAMPVQSVALAPGRHLLAVAAADGTLKLWDVAAPGRPALIATVENLEAGHPLYSAAFSPDGRVLATAGQDRKVRLWNVTDPRHPA